MLLKKQRIKDEPTVMMEVRAILNMLCSRRMVFFVPQIMWTGCSIAFWSGMLVPIMSW